MDIDYCIENPKKAVEEIEKENKWFIQFGVIDYLDFMVHYSTEHEWNLYNKYKSSWNYQLFKTFKRVCEEIRKEMLE